MLYRVFSQYFLSVGIVCLFVSPAKAQIVPDQSLMNEQSKVMPAQLIHNTASDLITGGARRGENLFHSFQDFNVQAGRGVYFDSPLGVSNILTRVTGMNTSNILGIIGVLGKANLFFLNPNGIIFGPKAGLDLYGSFLGTTATSFSWPNGTQFSAKNPQPASLLTVSVPIGLNFAKAPGSIEVNNVGYGYFTSYSLANIPTPLAGAGTGPIGLKVQEGKTLALIGGSINFDGGVVTSPAGQISIGSVGRGEQVKINPASMGWTFDYSNVRNFQDIQLENLSLLDASGTGNSKIHLQANRITFSNGSFAFIQNLGTQSSGDITINATESLMLNGRTNNPIPNFSSLQYLSGINITGVSAQGNNISISTKQLTLQSGGVIENTSLYSGGAARTSINASDFTKVIGVSPLNPIYTNSRIYSIFTDSATAGNILLNTGRLLISDGGSISSANYGTGLGGTVLVNAFESIILKNVAPFSLEPSSLTAATFGVGSAGNVIVNTPRLTLLDGGRVDSSTFASGKAGNVTINASKFVNVSGTVPDSINPSLIISAGNKVDSSLQTIFGLPSLPSGNSGNVTINTGRLSVTNSAQVTVRNDGSGDAGTLRINANSINLDSNGGITALTNGGKAGNIELFTSKLTLSSTGFLSAQNNGGSGGNITLQAKNFLIQNNSFITATAELSGTGGNIDINTGTLAALDNSSINANAVQGKGGNIQINTQGVFRSPDSRITATGTQSGRNGTVQVNTLVNNSTLGLVRLPIVPVDAAKLIAQGCGVNTGPGGNKFVVTGSGGLPPEPTDLQTGDTGVQADWVETTAPVGENRASSSSPKKSHHSDPDDDDDFVEATGMIRNAKGQIEFVAQAPTYTPSVPWIKSPSCHVR